MTKRYGDYRDYLVRRSLPLGDVVRRDPKVRGHKILPNSVSPMEEV